MDKKIIYWKGLRTIFGLMFQIPKKNTIYILDLEKEKKIDIHTFFCLKELDIILLNEKLDIVEIYEKVKPFRIIFPKNKFRFVLEGLDISKNDIITVKNYIKSNIL